MVERESIRYDGEMYRTTLVCKCGTARQFSITARHEPGKRPDAEMFILALAARIEDAGWLDGWAVGSEKDTCPDCSGKVEVSGDIPAADTSNNPERI